MSGRTMRLGPGRYRLDVLPGEGPAGIQRPHDRDVTVSHTGGMVEFSLDEPERVYFWWRGPDQPAGVNFLETEPSSPTARPRPATRTRALEPTIRIHDREWRREVVNGSDRIAMGYEVGVN